MIASYAADAVSYAATDKTITDHVFSAVARSDCSFIRVLKEKPICVDDPQQPVQVADAAAPAADAAPPPDPQADPATRDTYVIIGSFVEFNNAQRAMTRYAEYHPVILQVTAHGRGFNRVVAGPMSHDEAATLKAKMTAAVLPQDARRG
jgi:cell division septation protein DedD